MTRLADRARRGQPRPGLPGLPGPGRAQGGGRGRAPRRHQPVRDHLGRAAAARRDRREDRALLSGLGRSTPRREITVTCGATEGMIAAMLGLLDPGDEVIVFEPFYENYGPDAILVGRGPALRRRSSAPDWSIRPRRAARRRSRRGPGRSSSTRRTTRPARSSRRDELELIAGALPRARPARLHRRDLRAHRLRGRAHPDGDAARDARADGGDQLDVEDVLA